MRRKFNKCCCLMQLTVKQVISIAMLLVSTIFLGLVLKDDFVGPTQVWKVAFLGDTVLSNEELLRLLDSEEDRDNEGRSGLDAVVHQGDLTYVNGVEGVKIFEDFLGRFKQTFFFGAVGNYDVSHWENYMKVATKHNERVGNVHCEGQMGVLSYCLFHSILVVQFSVEDHQTEKLSSLQSSPSTQSNILFMRNAFYATKSTAKFRICSFHHPHASFRVQRPITDSVSLEVFELCRIYGAMIVNGHDHAYARTFPFRDFITTSFNKDFDDLDGLGGPPEANHLTLRGLYTFVVINGLGGKSVDQYNSDYLNKQWWASIYPPPKDNDTVLDEHTTGALFCEFFDKEQKVSCYFKTADGVVRDRFGFLSG